MRLNLKRSDIATILIGIIAIAWAFSYKAYQYRQLGLVWHPLSFLSEFRPFSYSWDWKKEGVVITDEYCNTMANPEIVENPNGCYLMYTHGWPMDDTSRNDVYAFSSCDGKKWKSEGMVIKKASMPAVAELPDGRVRVYFVRNTDAASGIMSAISGDGLHFSVEDGYRFVIGGGASPPRGMANWGPYYTVAGAGDPQKISHIAHLNLLVLDSGGYRIYFDESGMKADVKKYGDKAWPLSRVRSISSEDGINWRLDPGVRIDVEQEPLVLMQRAGSPSVIKTGNDYRMYFSAGFSPWEDLHPFRRWAWSGIYEAVSKDGLDFTIIDKRLLSGSDPSVIQTKDGIRAYISRSSRKRDSGGMGCINIESWIKKSRKWEKRSPAAASAADTTAPRIAHVEASSVGTSSAVISWETDEPADALVEYGLSISFGFESAFPGAFTNSHAITLSDLMPETSYYYRVRARDAAGNRSSSDEYRLRTIDRDADPNNSILTVTRVLAGQYDDAKYTVSVHDADGLSEIYVKAADWTVVWNARPQYGLFGGIRSCPKESVTTDALTFYPEHFPLTGYIVDCVHTGIKYPIEAAMPPVTLPL